MSLTLIQSSLGFFATFVFLLNSWAAVTAGESTNPENRFILIHDFDCKDERSILVALQESGALSEVDITTFERELNDGILEAKAHRLKTAENAFSKTNHLPHRLSEMPWKDRRDQIVAALNIFVSERRRLTSIDIPSRLFSLKRCWTVSHKFLEHVGMDIVDVSQLPHDQLFEFAAHLPCLQYPPERSKFSGPSHFSRPMASSVPNDFYANHQSYFDAAPKGVGVTEAWKCYNGQENGPVIAVIDSGCSTHPDLEDNLCRHDEDCAGFDAINGGSPFFEEFVHGTRTAGLIAQLGNNGYGLTGICLGCKIMCIKAADSKGVFHPYAILAAIDYILSKKNIVRITNHSYGGYSGNVNEIAAFKRLGEAGIIVVAASGNENCDMDKPYTQKCVDPKTRVPLGPQVPAGYGLKNIISVGSTNLHGRKSPFSNYGQRSVDLFVPGEEIVALCNTRLEKCKYLTGFGTSLSAPIMTGAIALLWGQDPSMTYEEVIEIVFKTVRKVPELADYCVTGGILDVGAAMKKVAERKKCTPQSLKFVPSPTGDNTSYYYPMDYKAAARSLLSPKAINIAIFLFSIHLLI